MLGCVFKGLKVSTEVSTEDLDTDGSGGKSTALFSQHKAFLSIKRYTFTKKKKNKSNT